MGESRLGTTVRAAIKAIFKKRTDRHMRSERRFRAVPSKARLSTRGERGDTWLTKKWTEARLQMRAEAIERRRKMARDRREKEKSKAAYVAREMGERVA